MKRLHFVAVDRLDHDRKLDLCDVFRIQVLIQEILRDAVNPIAFAGGLEHILVGKNINDLLRRIARQSQRRTNFAVDRDQNVCDSDENAIDFFLIRQRHKSRNIQPVDIARFPSIFLGCVARDIACHKSFDSHGIGNLDEGDRFGVCAQNQ